MDSHCIRTAAPKARDTRAAWGPALVLAASLAAHTHASAQLVAPGDQLMLAYGPHVIHFHPSPEHAQWNNLVALELQTDRTRIFDSTRATFGLAVFDNSFGQFSQYAYWGQLWDLKQTGPGTIYGKVTAGVLHGYKGDYKDKVPLNKFGYSPAIVPAIGYRIEKVSGELALLGANGLIFMVTYTFDPLKGTP